MAVGAFRLQRSSARNQTPSIDDPRSSDAGPATVRLRVRPSQAIFQSMTPEDQAIMQGGFDGINSNVRALYPQRADLFPTVVGGFLGGALGELPLASTPQGRANVKAAGRALGTVYALWLTSMRISSERHAKAAQAPTKWARKR